MNSWILLRNGKATNKAGLAHLSTWELAIREAWVAGAPSLPETPLHFFTLSSVPVVDLGLGSLNFSDH